MQQLIENCHAAYQRFNELTAALDRGEDVVAAHEDASAALRYALMDVRHTLNVCSKELKRMMPWRRSSVSAVPSRRARPLPVGV